MVINSGDLDPGLVFNYEDSDPDLVFISEDSDPDLLSILEIRNGSDLITRTWATITLKFVV